MFEIDFVDLTNSTHMIDFLFVNKVNISNLEHIILECSRLYVMNDKGQFIMLNILLKNELIRNKILPSEKH